jgi:hypothetical protein
LFESGTWAGGKRIASPELPLCSFEGFRCHVTLPPPPPRRSDNQIGDGGAVALAGAFRSLAYLKSLDLA